MAEKTKVNKLKSFLICALTSIILAVVMAIPMLAVGYMCVLYVLKNIMLWQVIVATVLLAMTESVVIVTSMGV